MIQVNQNKINNFTKEISYLRNNKYQENLKILISLLPDYFFEIPASSSGKYHPLFALGPHGLVRHTKVAVKIAKDLLDDDAINKAYTNNEKDLMLIALILHDGLKSGLQKSEHTRFDHPILISNYIKENSSELTLNEEEINFICDAITSHMGPWNINIHENIILPIPKTKYQRFVHMCDYLASRKYLNVNFDENNNIKE